MKERRIIIGAPTYNDFQRISNLFSSILTFTNKDQLTECKFLVVDDGTPDESKKDALKKVCKDFDILFLEHDKNYGIPKAWNTLSKHCDSDIVILLNDDIQICQPNWLKTMVYFLEKNDNVGSVGWPLYHIKPSTGQPNPALPKPNFDVPPGKVGAPVGCCFAFKKYVYDLIPGGFPEKLPSFYEEIFFGFELAKIGFASYMLSFPALEHWGSQTFAKNPELSIAKPNPEILSMEKYREIMIKKYPSERIEPVPGYVYRMDYSRVVFALHFGCKDLIENPQIEVHKRYVDILPKQKIKWLDKDMKQKEAEI